MGWNGISKGCDGMGSDRGGVRVCDSADQWTAAEVFVCGSCARFVSSWLDLRLDGHSIRNDDESEALSFLASFLYLGDLFCVYPRRRTCVVASQTSSNETGHREVDKAIH